MELCRQASVQTRGAAGLLCNNPVFNVFWFFFGNQHSLERQGCENELLRFKYAGKTELYQGSTLDVCFVLSATPGAAGREAGVRYDASAALAVNAVHR